MPIYRLTDAPAGWDVLYSTVAVWDCPNAAGELVEGALADVAVDAGKVAKAIATAHRRGGSTRERDAAGKLTSSCAVCGARLKLRGYRVWAERPWTDADQGKPYSYRVDAMQRVVAERERWASSRKQAAAIARELRDELEPIPTP